MANNPRIFRIDVRLVGKTFWEQIVMNCVPNGSRPLDFSSKKS